MASSYHVVTMLNSIDLENWLDSGSVSLAQILHKWCSGFYIASFHEANDTKLVGSGVESMIHPSILKSHITLSFNGYDCHL